MAKFELQAVISATDKASGVLKKIGDKTEEVGKKMTTGLTLPIVGVGVAAVKSFSDFETRMSNISTLISGDSTQAMKTLSSGIKDMMKEMPKSADDLGASAYDIMSAGISDASMALKVLGSAGKLAVAGLGTTQEATDILTSSINAFKLKAEDSDKISNLLFKTVKYGKTTVAELAQAFGATAPVVAAAGVSLEEFQAATAALTTTGQPAAQAQNSLRQAIVSLNKPTEDMTKLLKKAGYESGEAALKKDGLVRVMEKVKTAAKGNSETLAKAWGSVEALGSATALTGQVSSAFADTLKDMKGGADSVTEAFNKQKQTTAAQFQVLKNSLNVAMMELGNAVIPSLVSAMGYLTSKIQGLSQWWTGLSSSTQNFILIGAGLLAALGPIVSVVGNLITAISGVSAAVAFLCANPIVALIAGLVALGIGVAAIITHFNNKKQVVDQNTWAINQLKAAEDSYVKASTAFNQANLAKAQSQQRVNQLTEEIARLEREGKTATDEYRVAVANLAVEKDNLASNTTKAAEAEKTLNEEQKKVDWAKIIQNPKDAAVALKTMADQGNVAARALTNINEAALGQSIKSNAPSLGAPFKPRAEGGPVSAGQGYLVGEEGPEWFMPKKSGTIIPNGGMGGLSVSVNMNGVNINNTDNKSLEQIANTVVDVIARKMEKARLGA